LLDSLLQETAMLDLDRRVLLSAGLSLGLGLVSFEVYRRRSLIYKINSQIQSRLSVGPGTKITLVNTYADWENISDAILQDVSAFPFIGLDTEWVSKKGSAGLVSMLQLATYSGHCVLIRLCLLDKIPSSLRNILVDPDIIKVGVAVLDDGEKLLVDHNLEVAGCMDLRHLAVRQESLPGKLGLQSLALQYLSVELDKDWRLRAGNWEAETLTIQQINYAANDALVAVNILWVLMKELIHSGTLSKLHTFSWDQRRLVIACRDVVDQFTDVKFTNREWKAEQRRESGRGAPTPAPVALRTGAVRKSPLYHNCQLLAPDGQMLCTCDMKKAAWYVKKGLGDLISENPLTVRLKFEPSGRPEGKAGEYYLSVKPNICVVCGSKDSYLRKNVVPHEYRRYFPAVMKDHQSHDVLLMCVRCHQKSNILDAGLRSRLAHECGAPIGTENGVKLRNNFDLKRIKSAGKALASSRNKLPEMRRLELEKILTDHYQVDALTADIITDASNCNFLETNAEYTPHSRAVVQHYLREGGLMELEVRWRKHFLATMKPKYLPDLWSVNHQEERLGVKAAENRIDMEQYLLATQGADEELDLEEYRKIKKPQLGINPDLLSSPKSLSVETLTLIQT